VLHRERVALDYAHLAGGIVNVIRRVYGAVEDVYLKKG
jgi:hypothetical protein